MLNILMIGDIVGTAGREHLRRVLPAFKKAHSVHLTVANGENSDDRNGITPAAAEYIFQSGVDVITTGNHAFRRREVHSLLESEPMLLRPANYPPSAPGHGMCFVDLLYAQVCVINLMGVVYLDSLACPFDCADALLGQAGEASVVLVDFHAEATAEKKALAYYLDGRVSAVAGTHTHTQTADETILPNGTGFITDLGMTGPIHSVLGIRPELSIRKMRTKLPVQFEVAPGPCTMQGVLLQVDPKSGKCLSIERFRL